MQPTKRETPDTPQAEHWYRAYFTLTYHSLGASSIPHSVFLNWEVYPVLRSTDKSVTLDLGWRPEGQKTTRLVLRNAHKKFACPTREEALESLQARLLKQNKILRGQIRDNEYKIEAMKKGSYICHG